MKHLTDIDENYFVHAFLSLTYSARLLWLFVAGVIHAFFPIIFVSVVSRGVDGLSEDIESRRIRHLKPGLTD
jgi:hypothetical protein